MSKPTTKAPANPPAKKKAGKKKAGRPELPASEKTHPRSVRLNDARWAKCQRLGRDWLEEAIDAADEPK